MTVPHLSADERRIIFGPEPMKAGQEMTFVFVPGKGKGWESMILQICGDLDLLGIYIRNEPLLSQSPVPAEVLEHGIQVQFPFARVGDYIKLHVKARDADTVFLGSIAGQVLYE